MSGTNKKKSRDVKITGLVLTQGFLSHRVYLLTYFKRLKDNKGGDILAQYY